MRIFMGMLLTIAALTGVRLLTPASALELLSNGGFEDGATGWSWASATLSVVCGGEPAAEGDCSALLAAATAGTSPLHHQSVRVQAGATYTLSGFVLKNDPRAEFVQMLIVWYDADGNNVGSKQSGKATLNQDAFRQLSTGPVPAPPDAASAIVSIHLGAFTAGAQAYVDGVRLEGPAPTPRTPTVAPPNTLSPPTGTPPSTATPSATATLATSPTPIPTTTSVPPGIPDGYLLNEGFEETVGDGLLGWNKYGGILGQAAERRRSGNFSAVFFSDTESTKWVYQTVRVRTDKTYVFDGYVLLNDPAVERAHLRVSWYASDDGSGSAISISDSVEQLGCCDPSFRYIKTEPLSPPAGTRTAKFRVMLAPYSAAGARIYLDDMDLRETAPVAPPTPAPTVALEATAGEETRQVLSVATRAPSRRTAASSENGRPLPVESSLYQVKLNEVMYAPDKATGACEWLELYNAGDSPVQLEGWQIGDNHAIDAIPPLSLPARSFALVASDEEGFRRAHPDFAGTIVFAGDGKIGNGLADRGDRLVLRDEAGRLVDSLSYGDDSSVFSPPAPAVAAGHSLERSPAGADSDRADDFTDNPEPSPGRAIGGHREVLSATSGMSLAPASLTSAFQPESDRASDRAPWLWASLGAGLFIFSAGCAAAAAFWRLRVRVHTK